MNRMRRSTDTSGDTIEPETRGPIAVQPLIVATSIAEDPLTDGEQQPLTSEMATRRVVADGKHLAIGDRTFRVRGVTYGSFVPRADGARFPPTTRLRSDLEQIAAMGLNTVRLYDAPPIDLLDTAGELGLRVIVGVHYEDWRHHTRPSRRADQAVLDAGRRALDGALNHCVGRPEVLAVSVGNEIPADVVRVHGSTKVETTLSALVAHVRDADPDVLVTYTNYPTTEYLQVEGQTLATFNVFLEEQGALRRYLRHLQGITHDLPLVLSEVGLASNIHGDDRQASSLSWQLHEVDESGCAGAVVFSFTDEWGVNAQPVEGWTFGITTTARDPKPAAGVVSSWAARTPVEVRSSWPTISAVVCAYNEERTIRECLESLSACDYPHLEIIVCDDGSTDATLDIVKEFNVRILDLPHAGLSVARNAGIEASTGDIVAFLDADAACHRDWPWHLALSFDDESIAASGGPNLPVAGAPFIERVIAASPGAPMEVLTADDRAEHVPGCNMAFRREVLADIGGFNPIYTSAGDDVDVCWKILDGGSSIAFSPAAQIRHHRRGTVRGYLRQQRGYGRAEKLLSHAHPHRFNERGQARWTGVIYGGARLLPSLLRPVVYHGNQGHAPFQPIAGHRAEAAAITVGSLVPATIPLILASVLAGVLISPVLFVPSLALLTALAAYCISVGVSVPIRHDEPRPIRFRAMVALMHLLQPLARTWGRIRGPRNSSADVDRPSWCGDRPQWLRELDRRLRAHRRAPRVGGPFDDWDLEVRSLISRIRITVGVAWRWTPLTRTDLRLRPSALALTVGIASWLASADERTIPLIVLATWLSIGCIDTLRLRSAVSRAVAQTVEGVT